MYLLAWLVVIILLACQLETAAGVAIPNHPASEKIAPKVLIINLVSLGSKGSSLFGTGI